MEPWSSKIYIHVPKIAILSQTFPSALYIARATMLSHYIASSKICLLLLTGISSHISLSPPNAPVPSKQCFKAKSLFERCVRWITFCSKVRNTICLIDSLSDYKMQTMIWTFVLADVYMTLGSFNLSLWPPTDVKALDYHTNSGPSLSSGTQSNVSSHTSHNHQVLPIAIQHPLLSVSLPFIVGVFAVISGSALRIWCFRTLGDFFTFELTIRPTHVLVKTGPYAFVRHPSYTGIYLTLLGASIVALAPGSLLRESWLLPLLGSCIDEAIPYSSAFACWCASLLPTTLNQIIISVLVVFWFLKIWYALRSTNRRMVVEDEELHRAFGKAWEEYAKRVRWRLLPGIF